jgi:hypothetical protein
MGDKKKKKKAIPALGQFGLRYFRVTQGRQTGCTDSCSRRVDEARLFYCAFHICNVYITLFLGNKYMRPFPLKKTKLEPPFTPHEGEPSRPHRLCALMSRHQAFPRGRRRTFPTVSAINTFDCVCTALIIRGAHRLATALHFSITIPRPSITQQLPVYGQSASTSAAKRSWIATSPSTRGPVGKSEADNLFDVLSVRDPRLARPCDSQLHTFTCGAGTNPSK